MAVHTAPTPPPSLRFGNLNNGIMFRLPGDPERLYIKHPSGGGFINARLIHPPTGDRGRLFAAEDAVEIVDIVDVTVVVKRR